ncbi:uncharacterized protein BJ171DRAFT_585048 [Polychytrium aggregatum]|uniref:uncharacterized protein n=1 Tax=Polychytrium aggregatum TaxID=110093 RepID=UPI0022FEF322|nr:uncharacterized protein BJ171DRAFT_585048 [Polychytrium aggregatum]KAI9199762.1 hypothetical protein BJ171DRAFT_585048 [Polychytrium aggregatum]
MPVILKEFEWTQTSTHIYIDVEVKGLVASKTDVYCNSLYLRVNFAPYFFEIDLFDRIIHDASTASLGNDCVKLVLQKAEEKLWTTCAFVCKSRDELRQRREQGERELRLHGEHHRAERARQQKERDHFLVKKQIEAEREGREQIQRLKAEERALALASLSDTTLQIKPQLRAGDYSDDEEAGDSLEPERDSKTLPSETLLDEVDEKTDGVIFRTQRYDPSNPANPCSGVQLGGYAAPDTIIKSKAIFDSQEDVVEAPDADSDSDSNLVDMDVIRARVRQQLRNQYPQAKWLARIKTYQEQLRVESGGAVATGAIEDQPKFLKERADTFFRAQNFEAALNAYTKSIEAQPRNPV